MSFFAQGNEPLGSIACKLVSCRSSDSIHKLVKGMRSVELATAEIQNPWSFTATVSACLCLGTKINLPLARNFPFVTNAPRLQVKVTFHGEQT